MELNKKGIFFTFAAIALSIIIIFSFKVYTEYGLKDKMGSIEIRVDTMNNFIIDLENDIENAIFIVGFRSLLSLEDYMMENDEFLNVGSHPSLDSAFDEAFRLGTINSENMDLMENNTFLDWVNKMKVQANKTDITLDFTVNSVTIAQSGPWKVNITVNLDIDVQDKKNTASWTIENKDYIKKINITSEGSNTKFVDPLYLVNTNGVANNTIRKTPFTNWPADLSSHMFNGYYRPNTDAPSYLDRFENDLTGSAHGIESLVTQVLKSGGLPVSSKSSVDHIYFSTSNPVRCRVEGVADNDFYLDDPTHKDYYNAVCRV